METWRVDLLGETSVGKTTLAMRWLTNEFFEPLNPTIEDDYRKQVVVDDRTCSLNIADIGSEEWPRARARHRWPQENRGFIIVYTVLLRETFNRVNAWHQCMKANQDDCVFMLVGNQSDKMLERQVSEEEGAVLARQLGCRFVETSAKTGQNVDELFTHLVQLLRQTTIIDGAADPPAKKKRTGSCNIM
ncbi:P-loop containing nucleoside triphosphate hydrolase protein [Crassisporium funariophilum]|nr:P-loop containing nucleoside triphosphate hydrolase protein [Crassisporium funariophilum]